MSKYAIFDVKECLYIQINSNFSGLLLGKSSLMKFKNSREAKKFCKGLSLKARSFRIIGVK